MFYDIEESKVLLVIDEEMGYAKEFSPDDIIKYIKNTNSPISIRGLLTKIPEGKEAEYKEAILSMVERREHASANIETMRKIAERGGFLEEFEETHVLEKWIPRTSKKHKVFIAKSKDEITANVNLEDYNKVVCDFDGFKAVVDADKVFVAKSNRDLQANPDLTKYDMVVCDFEGNTKFADLTKIPKKMIIKGDIDWWYKKFEKLPDISESIVYGFFICHTCKNLISLEGAPKCIGGKFDCRWCESLISTKGMPEEIGGVIYCYDTPIDKFFAGYGIYLKKDGKIYDIFDLPKDKEFVINGDLKLNNMCLKKLPDLSNVIVKGTFDCHCNPITSLKGAPKEVGGNFNCCNCNKLTSAKGLPEYIGGKLHCDNHLRSSVAVELGRREMQAQKQSENKIQKSGKLSNIFSRLFGKGK